VAAVVDLLPPTSDHECAHEAGERPDAEETTNMTLEPFHCGICGASVESKTGTGRMREYRRGVPLPVPDDFGMPTCTGCGEEYLSVEQAEALDALQAPAYATWQTQHVVK